MKLCIKGNEEYTPMGAPYITDSSSYYYTKSGAVSYCLDTFSIIMAAEFTKVRLRGSILLVGKGLIWDYYSDELLLVVTTQGKIIISPGLTGTILTTIKKIAKAEGYTSKSFVSMYSSEMLKSFTLTPEVTPEDYSDESRNTLLSSTLKTIYPELV